MVKLVCYGVRETEVPFFEEINKKGSNKFDYYEVIGTMSNHLPNNSLLKEDMTLAVYVALYKQIEKQKK